MRVPTPRALIPLRPKVRGKGGRLALEAELAEVRAELAAAFPLIR